MVARTPEGPTITLNDVAREAGVSASTVSHVINGTRFVAPATADRVRRAIERLHYAPNIVARNLKTGRSRVIGLLISDITNPHFTGLVRGVEDVANRAGYHMILCNTDEDPAKELDYLRMLRGKGVDGILLAPTGVRHDYLDHLLGAAFPIVCFDRALPGLPCDAVLADNVRGAYEAVSHLIALGHRRIGIIARLARAGASSQRLEGYRRALRAHGIAEAPALIKNGNSRQDGGYRRTLELLDLPEPPSAIFAANNLTTLGVLAALQGRGKRVPEDIAVAGFDDFEWALLMRPRLTTVAQPTYEIGKRAAEMLLARIEGRTNAKPRRVVLPTRLVVRESCGANGHPQAHELDRLYGRAAAPVAVG